MPEDTLAAVAQQDAAVRHGGSALVVACPGSGKTRVLTRRVLEELAKSDRQRRRVLAVTYTNRAADEILERLDAAGADHRRLWAGTIHSFCLEWVLRPYAGCLERLRRGFRVIDERVREELLDDLRARHGADRYFSVNTRRGRMGDAENDSDLARAICSDYHASLEASHLIDFDLILSLGHDLVMAVPEIPRVLGAVFSAVCIDEYQDTQDLQYAILASVVRASEGRCTLFVVGDPDQAIYASLGGVARSADEIRGEFGVPDLAELNLSGNFRSTQRIVDYFSLFGRNRERVRAHGEHAGEGGTIVFLNGTVEREELGDRVARIVSDRLAAGCPESEIAVVAPQWMMVTSIARRLAATLPGVSLDAPGLSPFRRSRENPWYRLARLVLCSPSPAMFSTRLRWAREILTEFGGHPEVLVRSRVVEPRHLLRAVNGLPLSGGDGLEAIKSAFAALWSGLGVSIVDRPELTDAHAEFFASAKKCLEDPHYSFPNSIEAFRRAFGKNRGVVVGTCHGVKGEEFDTVVAFGLLRGYVPNWQEIIPNEERAEESARRLLYVIASRAKRHLFLIAEGGRMTRRGGAYETARHLQRLRYEYD